MNIMWKYILIWFHLLCPKRHHQVVTVIIHKPGVDFLLCTRIFLYRKSTVWEQKFKAEVYSEKRIYSSKIKAKTFLHQSFNMDKLKPRRDATCQRGKGQVFVQTLIFIVCLMCLCKKCKNILPFLWSTFISCKPSPSVTLCVDSLAIKFCFLLKIFKDGDRNVGLGDNPKRQYV